MGRRVAKCFVDILNHTSVLTRETSFALAYGMEVVILLEIGLPTLRNKLEENNGNNVVIT